jgi:hypothetical protein
LVRPQFCEAIRVVLSETIARGSNAWADVAWTRPVAVPFDRDGPADRGFSPPAADFIERSVLPVMNTYP